MLYFFSRHTHNYVERDLSEKGSRPTVFRRIPTVPATNRGDDSRLTVFRRIPTVLATICGDDTLFNYCNRLQICRGGERRHSYVHCYGRSDTIQGRKMSSRWCASRNLEKGQTEAVEKEGNNGNVCPPAFFLRIGDVGVRFPAAKVFSDDSKVLTCIQVSLVYLF
ncbi:hypothetical protein HanXRQr2_Chr16g0755641 [Helianthus annuus]|uniref:Uncharacterized protein n=1 Tax=Helianthus annuus TaxID=4232 RepID=A0A251S025_HELAN|nr:hypothetical protein HanXRQr2_Chr16g0755641 [Helianthus annuus]KAJ0443466.1 hypothetical protein HanIR_Chr16g0821061 [Helianthus annuus]KAJ0821775.1 hypothetical protein HanPSC8_Chr16g0724171 [Helianthus annuus]